MSVIVTNEKTANHVVNILVDLKKISELEAQSFLDMMMLINVKSVNTRYNENNKPPKYVFERTRSIIRSDFIADELQAVKNVAFFMYQSCEFDGYDNTLIFKILNDVKNELTKYCQNWCVSMGFFSKEEARCKQYHELPYSDDCLWGLED